MTVDALKDSIDLMEKIVSREIKRMHDNETQFDEKIARTAELLGKCLDMCFERRAKLPPPDPFEGVSDSDLAKDFE